MGKKRIITKEGATVDQALKARALSKGSKRRVVNGKLSIEATYNNTKVILSDSEGNTLAWSSSGALGFKGAKKGTPYAAAKVGELLAEKAEMMGIKTIAVLVRGVGAGREAAIRSFATKGINVSEILDATPVPHNGPKPKKPRRV